MKRILAAFTLAMPLLVNAALAEGQAFPPITDEATLKECSACHMAFQPQMLPARSWEAIMTGLDDHFGEVATLDQPIADGIKAYLMANAADAGNGKSRWMRGIPADQTPLRITETPRWIRAHQEEISPKAFLKPEVGSKANCKACHAAADKGYFEDD